MGLLSNLSLGTYTSPCVDKEQKFMWNIFTIKDVGLFSDSISLNRYGHTLQIYIRYIKIRCLKTSVVENTFLSDLTNCFLYRTYTKTVNIKYVVTCCLPVMLLRQDGNDSINTWKYHNHNCVWVSGLRRTTVLQRKAHRSSTHAHTDLREGLLPDVKWTWGRKITEWDTALFTPV